MFVNSVVFNYWSAGSVYRYVRVQSSHYVLGTTEVTETRYVCRIFGGYHYCRNGLMVYR
jgi:hypothetical protein